MRPKLTSRKLWITIVAMVLPAALFAGSAGVLIFAPEKASALTGVMAAISAILTTVAGAVYVVTEGKIDLRALPQALDPVLQAVVDLAGRSAAFYEELARLAESHLGAAEPPEGSVKAPQ